MTKKKSNVKISVIIPAFNTDKYISKCLESILSQTLKELEIIVINDGSTDKTKQILNDYCKKHQDVIKVFNTKNLGPSNARNLGIKNAIGEYITFLDSDDYIEKDAYKKMYDKAKSENFDVVICDINYVFENKIKYASSGVDEDIYTKDDIKKIMPTIYSSVWNKIYKSELIKKIQFKNGVWYEDVEYIYRLIPELNNIGVVKEPFINYVQRQGAITKTFDERIYNQVDNWNGLIKYYKETGIYDYYNDEFEYCYVKYMYISFLKTAINYSNFSTYKEAVTEAIKCVKQKFPKYRKNKYLKKINLKSVYLMIFNKYIAYLIYFLKKR